jgi:hypothetical protein
MPGTAPASDKDEGSGQSAVQAILTVEPRPATLTLVELEQAYLLTGSASSRCSFAFRPVALSGRHQFVLLILAGRGLAANLQNELGEEIRSSKFDGLEEAASLSNKVGPGARSAEGGNQGGGRGLQDSIWTNSFFFWQLDRSFCRSLLVGASVSCQLSVAECIETQWRFSLKLE